MNKVAVISFTAGGCRILKKLKDGLSGPETEVSGYAKTGGALSDGILPLEESVFEWTKRHFEPGNCLIFIGAAGIAVRAVAPFLKGKASDPAVVVVDESGKYAISLLSGHLGGANAAARAAAAILGAEAVITTATDLNHKFAVDLFAKQNGLAITDFKLAKLISAEVLKGGRIGFFCDFMTGGEMPEELCAGEETHFNIHVTVNASEIEEGRRTRTLRLVPKSVVLGVGCKKGVEEETIKQAVYDCLDGGNIDPASLCAIASIDLKAEEPGLSAFSKSMGVPFEVYSAGELSEAAGDFAESEFVYRVTGVGNVCERAAISGCGKAGGRLLLKKTAANGVTVAAACKEMTVYF